MYTPLYIKTDYSLLSSLIKIDNLIKNLKQKNITSCAIVDDNLFGTMEFIKKCEKEGINPIIGLDIPYKESNILLYTKNYEGYQNLIKIETIKNEEEINIDILKKYSSELIAICFNEAIYNELKDTFTDLFVGVSNINEEKNVYYTKNTIYVNKTLYLEKYEYKYLPYVFMIRDSKTISDGINFIYQDNYLKSYDEVFGIVSSTSLINTLKLSDMCNIVFPKELYMPKFDNDVDSKSYLIELANKGLNKRLNNEVSDIYKKRLNYELDVILDMHFEDYFLVVYDFIRYAKLNHILVGPGRGSAAGSLVCYCLGITDVDPIKYNLLFERFLNKDRITLPDIDTDIPDDKRDEVISYVKDKYGAKNVAGIITFGTLKAKQALRDVGRVLNIKLNDIDYICKKINMNESLKDFKKRCRDISNFIDSDDKLKMMYEIACLVEDNKRHTSIHAAGIVISREKLDNVIPIIKNDDMYLTEYTMEHLEELGLIKMDFLGIKNLSIISNIIDEVNKTLNLNISFNKIPLDDYKTYELFKKGETTGIFQFKSEGMKRFLIDLEPNTFTDISNAIALYRPGPASNIPLFIERKKGYKDVDYIVTSLESILKETYGIIVYQEQIMEIARTLAGYSLSEADLLRRAMSKKKFDILKQEEEKFITGCISNGYSYEISKKVYDHILAFANYGFNKSHSVAYSIVSYKMAYLKAHFPKFFYSNLLEGVVGSEVKTLEYIKELKKLDIKVLPPDINLSLERRYRVVDNGIIMPLSVIRNVGGVIAHYIVEERKNGEYKDIFDFLTRIYKRTNNKKVIESLIYAKCFKNFGYNTKTLLENYEELDNYATLASDLGDISKPNLKVYDENFDEALEHEKEVFGFYLTSHKTEKYKLTYKVITDANDIKAYLNKKVNVIVSVDKIKELTTKNGGIMAFLTGSDNTGYISITIFPKEYEEIKKLDLKKYDIVMVNGRIEKRFDTYSLIFERLRKLN